MKVPSITKTNHRYRGPMESIKHNLFMHQIVHDIEDLRRFTYRNDYNPGDIARGQQDIIADNHDAVMNGNNAELVSTIIRTNILMPAGHDLILQHINNVPISHAESGEPPGLGQHRFALGVSNRVRHIDRRTESIIRMIGGL